MTTNKPSRFDIPKEILKDVVSPGIGPLETGYKEFTDGSMLISAYIRMDNCKGKMVNWWFGSFLTNTQSYKLWHPDHNSFEWDDKKQPGTPVGGTHLSEEILGGVSVPMTISFYDPKELFSEQELKDGGISCALTGEVHLPDGTMSAAVIHLVRDTPHGCEMRNRFWLPVGDVEAGRGMLQHNLAEMGNLAQILPTLYHNVNID